MFSLMSKPMLVTLPFVLLLLDYWPLARWQRLQSASNESRYKSAGWFVWEKVPFFIFTITASAVALWSHHEAGSVSSADFLPFLTRLSNAIFSYAAYLWKIFWPVNLAVYYPYEISLPLWKVLVSALMFISMTTMIIYFIKKMPFLFVGWFWYLGTLVPVIGIIQVGSQSMADRYTYLPSIGIAIMLTWGVSSMIKNENIRKMVLLPAAIALSVVFMVLTLQQSGYWKDSMTLFNRALQVTNNNYIAHNHMALSLQQKKNFSKAIYHFNEAIRINPIYAHAYLNRGNVYYILGNKESALADFKKAIDFIPRIASHAAAFNNLGVTYTDMGNYKPAIDNFNVAIMLKPDYADAYNNRGLAYFNQEKKELGCQDAQKACKLGNCKALALSNNKGLCHEK